MKLNVCDGDYDGGDGDYDGGDGDYDGGDGDYDGDDGDDGDSRRFFWMPTCPYRLLLLVK